MENVGKIQLFSYFQSSVTPFHREDSEENYGKRCCLPVLTAFAGSLAMLVLLCSCRSRRGSSRYWYVHCKAWIRPAIPPQSDPSDHAAPRPLYGLTSLVWSSKWYRLYPNGHQRTEDTLPRIACISHYLGLQIQIQYSLQRACTSTGSRIYQRLGSYRSWSNFGLHKHSWSRDRHADDQCSPPVPSTEGSHPSNSKG